MSYKINKTDGELLVDLVDGSIDNTTTDITLIGRNYTGFGEVFNENLIKILENFASTSTPGSPLTGQLWFDTADQRLKIYTGTTFKSAGGPVVSGTQPSNLVAGDLWIDNENNKLYFFDGEDLVLVGPEYSASQGKTGFEVDSVVDTTNTDRTVLKLFIGGVLVGIYSRSTFTPGTGFEISGYTGVVQEGFNVVNSTFEYRGTATNARALVDEAGVERTAANFIPSDSNGSTTGSLQIKNSAGLSVGIGDSQYSILKIVGTTTVLENQQGGSDMNFRVRTISGFKSAIYVDTSEDYVGIWNASPTTNLDVTGNGRFTGNLEVEGNLTVGGDTTFINASTLRIEDKNIELGITEDSTTANDAAVDGGGIILRSSDLDKEFVWRDSTNAWTSSEHIDLEAGKEYKIGTSQILSETTLGSSVVNSSLTNVGVLTELDVDNVNINGRTITTTTGGLIIVSAGDVSINSQKITGLADPDSLQDAATKNYVDTEIASQTVVLALDITGMSTPTSEIASYLQDMISASALENGTVAKIHTTNYTGTTVTGIDVASAMSKSFVAVDSNGVQNESVVQDVNFSNASGTLNLSPSRALYTFTVESGSWVYSSVSSYP